jgi:hypothetical protein
MKNLLWLNILIIFLIQSPTSIIIAQQNNKLFQFTPQAGLRFFTWEETLEDGTDLLEENGMLYGVGAKIKIKFGRILDLYMLVDGSAYLGTIDYEGYLQDNFGNLTPYKSETNYSGGKLMFNFGYDFYLNKQLTLSPEFGFQYEYWKRDIDNGGQYGYDEFYKVFFVDFGSNFLVSVSSDASIFLKVLGEYPVSISESIDFASRGQGGLSDVNLQPENNFGVNLELGVSVYGALFSFGYEYLLFSKSDPDQDYHQPESDRGIIKLNIGYTF